MERPRLPNNDRSLTISWTEEGHLRIVWADGHESLYAPVLLRRLCPCAHCRMMPKDDRGNLRILIMPNLTIQNVEGVGNYGICFTFSDGHHFGIYPYPYLRQACPCVACRGSSEGDSLERV
jgi:DUF971 family protein